MTFMVIPKRKMHLPGLRDGIQQRLPPMLPSAMVVVPTLNLSGLMIDTAKDWAGFAIENLGAASDNTGAARKTDLDTAIVFIIDGGGSVITTGEKGYISIPFDCTYIRGVLLADVVGSIRVDIWHDTQDNFPPTDADFITDYEIIDTQIDIHATPTPITILKNDIFAFYVASCTTITRVTLTLIVRRT